MGPESVVSFGQSGELWEVDWSCLALVCIGERPLISREAFSLSFPSISSERSMTMLDGWCSGITPAYGNRRDMNHGNHLLTNFRT